MFALRAVPGWLPMRDVSCRLQLGISGAVGDGHVAKDHSFAVVLRIGRGLLEKRFAGLSDHGHRVVLLVESGISVGGGHGLGHGVVLRSSGGSVGQGSLHGREANAEFLRNPIAEGKPSGKKYENALSSPSMNRSIRRRSEHVKALK
ncbi:hypothetical protein AVEN_196650-1 [Araneus ventricosus]|uniref:Uncharacterized protein n=1 Tax=Araneus ventricosus TaxID=182803 RepID=A0A4Y2E713_ARAVE|nr:hypothetical protein AVEN_196650-1 [Araneus ventricosus]